MEKKYLDKIRNFLMEDNIIDLQLREIRVSNVTICTFINIFFNFPPEEFVNFCRDMYGLEYNDSLYIWEGYSENIYYKITW